VAQRGFAWGREGHEVVALIAGHYMTGAAKAKTTALLDGSSIEAVASWADDYRRDHRETAPWHLINSPLTHYRICSFATARAVNASWLRVMTHFDVARPSWP